MTENYIINVPTEPINCSICLSSLDENNEAIKTLPCSHSYHEFLVLKNGVIKIIHVLYVVQL